MEAQRQDQSLAGQAEDFPPELAVENEEQKLSSSEERGKGRTRRNAAKNNSVSSPERRVGSPDWMATAICRRIWMLLNSI
ncbi:hypothetical protein P3339_16645 [Microbulbifer sp. MLAF003]|uniref:hypothetical protein n=1 Tax=Microbulbifer sp. MLAF003 TaxID=3032582 RepID=UPI0024AD0B4D|nr:hypothetical protein [Microbulbifer sp. MLAF003]WHI50065.1 hypothetical protein P3339_16645 [Microbulbifer sp. MLAF003]